MTLQIKNIDISNCSSRKEIRTKLVTTFLAEEPGTGKGDNASKYRYFVETLSDGSKIFLERPARLNKGMDFVVNIENFVFYSNKPNKKGTFAKIPAPAHHNILDDLKEKKLSNPSEYKKLRAEIDNIFNVRPYTHKNIKFKSGLPVEVLLNLIKWLFIEQDVTYWNFSGRNMLMEGINNI